MVLKQHHISDDIFYYGTFEDIFILVPCVLVSQEALLLHFVFSVKILKV